LSDPDDFSQTAVKLPLTLALGRHTSREIGPIGKMIAIKLNEFLVEKKRAGRGFARLPFHWRN
jgi:hypothetical protein